MSGRSVPPRARAQTRRTIAVETYVPEADVEAMERLADAWAVSVPEVTRRLVAEALAARAAAVAQESEP